jgi:phosphate transport system permease protein
VTAVLDDRAARTVVGTSPPPVPPPDAPRPIRGVRTSDVLEIVGAALAAISLTSLMFFVLTPFSGLLGYVVVAFVLFVSLYALLVSMDGNRPLVADRTAATIVVALAALLLIVLVTVIVFAFVRGRSALANLNFFVEDMRQAGPLQPLTDGGILHAIVGTLQQITIALVVVVPLGILCAVFLSEVSNPFSRFVRTIVEAMTALPSIIAGLFIYAALILQFGVPRSGFAAAMALAIMALPIVIRAGDVVLRLVPGTLKEAAAALGAPRWRIMWHVTLPTARSGLMTSVILGTARAIGETSPVLLTAGATTALNLNPFDGPQVSLPLATFNFTRSSEETFIARGFGTAAVLLVLVLVLFAAARAIGGRGPGELTSRQLRRRLQRSERDRARIEATGASGASSGTADDEGGPGR